MEGLKNLEGFARWLVVGLGVIMLIRLRLVLFAAALPLLAYWHFSSLEKTPEKFVEEEDHDNDDDPTPKDLNDPEDFEAKKETDIYGDEFWAENQKEPERDGFSWDAGRDDLDDLLDADFGHKADAGAELGKERKSELDMGPMAQDLKEFGLGPLAGLDDSLGLGGDFDFNFDRPEKPKGKGKSKDKGKEPREADPKQVFVANISEAHEDDLRAFFEQAGEVERLKILRNPDGSAKGIGFVTFRTEEQAQKALSFHGRPFEGGSIVVRLAHAGKKGEKGDKGEGRDRDHRDHRDRDEERHDRFERPERERNNDRKGKGKGKSKGHNDVEDALEEALQGHDGPVRISDFDFAARRFLAELRSRDKLDGGSRFQEAMDMVLKYTSSKDRGAVRKWTAYVFTLLQKFDPALSEEIRGRDAERRKGNGKRRQTSEDD